MSRTIRPIAYILLALILGYSSYWFYLADRAESYIQDRLVIWRQAGLDVRYSGLSVSGFPYRLVLEFDDARARLDEGPLDLSAGTGTLTAIAQPWNFRHVILEAEQVEGSLSLAGGAVLDGRYSLSGPRSSIRLAANGAGRISLVAGTTLWNGETAGEGLEFHIRLPARDEQAGTGDSLMAPLMAEISAELSLTGQAALVYSLNAALRGPAPSKLSRPVLQSWRDAGGTLEVAGLSATGEFGRLSAEGSLSLDEGTRPLGVLVISANDTGTLLEGFVGMGIVPSSQRDILEDQLAGSTEARLNLTLQEGRIYLGPLQLGETPSLAR